LCLWHSRFAALPFFVRLAATSSTFAGARIAVLEPRPPQRLDELRRIADADLRTFAITPSSRRLLQAAGAWDLMESVRAPAFSRMQVWDALGPGYVRFAAPQGAEALGWILENRVLQSSLFERLIALGQEGKITLLCPSTVAKVTLPPAPDEPVLGGGRPAGREAHELASVTLADGRVLRSRLIVGADGAASAVRQAGGIGTWGWDYDQRAVVATVALSDTLDTAWQRFLPHGPVAVLPLWEGYASIVWSTTPSHADYLTGSLSPQGFTDALNTVLTADPETFAAALRGEEKQKAADASQDLGQQPGSAAHAGPGEAYVASRDTLPHDPLTMAVRAGTTLVQHLATASFQSDRFMRPPLIAATLGARASFPLRLMKANSYVRPRLALVGDAAHVVHPLAGQGLNLGLGDAEALAAAIEAAADIGGDVGTLGALRPYERSRGAHNLLMMGAMDSIKRVFAGPPVGMGGIAEAAREPLAVARSLGMLVLNGSTPLKSHIAEIAMGGAP
jgi:ubiquinone biosynthesis monooxygenase Coq6